MVISKSPLGDLGVKQKEGLFRQAINIKSPFEYLGVNRKERI
jgi:hypothetical protein